MHIIYITWLINTQDRNRFYSSHFATENQLHVQYGCFTFLPVYAFQKLISSTICSWVRFKTEENNFFFVSKSFMGCHTGLPQNDHHRAIGMLEAGMTINDFAVSFGVYHTTIWRLAQSFRTTGAAKYRSRSGRPNILTLREERYIRITAGQCSARQRSSLHQLFTGQRC